MLNEDKVILMTKLASYEQNEGKKNIAVSRYFRSDYISVQMIKSVIFGTIAYGLVLGLYILYDIENFMMNVYKMDFMILAKNLAIGYLGFLMTYGLITYVIYSMKYKNAKKGMRCYCNNLKKLSSRYE